MAKINLEEADLCCDSCEVHENLVKIVNETMPDETELYDLAELFKVFGDSTRPGRSTAHDTVRNFPPASHSEAE